MIFTLAKRKPAAKWYLGASGEQTEQLPPHKDEWYIVKKTFPFSTVLFNTCVVHRKGTVPGWELCRVVRVGKPRDSAEPQALTAPGSPAAAAVPNPMHAWTRQMPFVL